VKVTDPPGVGTDLMTLRQAAERTGLSATTLRRYIKAGRLRARLIPGRYGPEYVVDEHDLKAAGLQLREEKPAAGTALAPASQAAGSIAPPGGSHDMVPGILYRELLMKHEHLLVQYGMMRMSGQQLYEIRQEADRRAAEARRAAEELARIRDRHAREIGQLKARLRQMELELQEKDDEIRRLEVELKKLRIAERNARRALEIEQKFSRFFPGAAPPAAAPVPPPRPRGNGETLRDH